MASESTQPAFGLNNFFTRKPPRSENNCRVFGQTCGFFQGISPCFMAFFYRQNGWETWSWLPCVCFGRKHSLEKNIWNLKKSWLEDEQFSFEMVTFLGDILLMVHKSGYPVEFDSLSQYLQGLFYIPGGAGFLPLTVLILERRKSSVRRFDPRCM